MDISDVRKDEIDVEDQTEMADSVEVVKDDSEPAEVTVEEASDHQPSSRKTHPETRLTIPLIPRTRVPPVSTSRNWANRHLRK